MKCGVRVPPDTSGVHELGGNAVALALAVGPLNTSGPLRVDTMSCGAEAEMTRVTFAVAGSMRASVSEISLPTHAAPLLNAMLVAPAPTDVARTTGAVPAFTCHTSPVKRSGTQIEPPPTANAETSVLGTGVRSTARPVRASRR